ncbi:hypothetical protein HX021_06680 [Sphingobacterium sp. N143]|uniref:hypothetical protein n=1 Tax=Sphingobacterium sp. N143 TaxID=2746727 RepID=UPI002576B7CC|nr:hypothetical protein [Sphingobacterium sp. N143]MDM1293979.1 hypothetical protein [Sphingobacterium sp. N143]
MKTITSFLLKFALAASVLALIFRYFLSYGIENKAPMIIIVSSVLYGVAMFINGFYFGKKDSEYLPIYDVGFRFHFTTYLIHNTISELWFILGFKSPYEKIEVVHVTTLIWGIFLIIHFIFFLRTRKNTINSLNKEDLFE